MTQKNRVFGTSLVGGYGVEIKIEADITVLVTYCRSQEKDLERHPDGGVCGRHHSTHHRTDYHVVHGQGTVLEL